MRMDFAYDINMFKNIIYLLKISLLTSLVCLFSLQLTTSYAFSLQENKIGDPIIEKVEGDVVTFKRSNPKWSWNWFYKKIMTSNQKTFLKGLEYNGIVGGDIKADNVEIVVRDFEKTEIGIIDVDDSGVGPLLIDFLQSGY